MGYYHFDKYGTLVRAGFARYDFHHLGLIINAASLASAAKRFHTPADGTK